ncbi:hypothetical protein I4U23_011629 [Adineta vaga]|nr:hypothetical protein I4U23_011629 [Adineta vaga]
MIENNQIGEWNIDEEGGEDTPKRCRAGFWNPCLSGLIIGALCAGITLGVITTQYIQDSQKSMTSTVTTSTTTSTTSETTSTTTSTTSTTSDTTTTTTTVTTSTTSSTSTATTSTTSVTTSTTVTTFTTSSTSTATTSTTSVTTTTTVTTSTTSSTSTATTTTTTTSATTSTTSIALPSQCLSYTTNTDSTRNAGYSNSNSDCDQSIFGTTGEWIRFLSPAGTRIITYDPGHYYCGTDAPGWYRDSYPASAGITVNGTICYSWSSDSCLWSNTILITHCDTFYVFLLIDTEFCSLRYCTA